MKRVIYIFFSLIILSSCNSISDLNGIWIGAYRVDYSINDSTFSSMRLLLDFSNDEVVFKKFDYPMFSEKDSEEKVKFLVSKNYLIIDSDTFQIRSLTKDSLTLIFNSDQKQKLVFKKLREVNESLRIDIKNKAFLLKGPSYRDSIDFINDSTIIHIGNIYNTRYRSSHWAINSYKSLNFLVLDQHESPPFLISNTSINELSLKLFYTNVRDFKMTALNNIRDTIGLIGNWVSPNPYISDIPLPPPPLNYPEDVDVRLYLRIKTDSIEIEQFGRSNSKKWILNSTNDFIYFPKELEKIRGVWKIVKLEGDKLTIERNSRSLTSMEKEVIRFTKEKNSR